jgi:hypothetical protein
MMISPSNLEKKHKRLGTALTVLATVAFLGPALALHAEDFSRTLHATQSPHVSINTGAGYIHLVRGGGDEVRITGHVRADSSWLSKFAGENPADRVHKIVSNPPIEQSGANVMIGHMLDRELYRNIVIDYDIVLPAKSIAEANSGSGDVRAASLEGAFVGNTGSGDIEVNDMPGGIHLQTGSGSIRAGRIHGSVYLQTGSGDIQLQDSATDDVKAQTGSGSIRLHGVGGALRVNTGSGDIEAEGPVTAPWRAETGSGSVRLRIGSSARFNLEASTGSGSIHTDQPLTVRGSIRPDHISGTVNGGGPTVSLHTGSGDIEIR